MASATQRRILVVDDEPDFAAYLKTILEGEGFSVTTASDGEAALSYVKETPPDLVTLDVQMPRKTGVLFYRQMKSVPEFRSIPVVVITGLHGLDDYSGPVVERFFDVDKLPVPDAFLGKPIEKKTLLTVVRAKLGSSAGRPQGT